MSKNRGNERVFRGRLELPASPSISPPSDYPKIQFFSFLTPSLLKYLILTNTNSTYKIEARKNFDKKLEKLYYNERLPNIMYKKKNIELLKEHKMSIIDLEKMHQSAICIPLIETKNGNEEEYEILFEVRSPKVHHQPGDICFPGGMIEPEEKPMDAAVREICEELCINPEQVQLLGATDLLIGSSIVVYPYVVLLKDYKNTFRVSEVKEIFSVPLKFFFEHKPESYEVERPALLPENFPYDRIVGGRNYKWRRRFETVYFYQYHHYTIWGMTAKILYSFINIWKSL